MAIIGRTKECRELLRLTKSDSSEFIAIYGRRRVGKTFLVKEFYKQQFTFYASGICRGDRATQLKCFQDALMEYGYTGNGEVPQDWFEAFERLKTIIVKSRKTER